MKSAFWTAFVLIVLLGATSVFAQSKVTINSSDEEVEMVDVANSVDELQKVVRIAKVVKPKTTEVKTKAQIIAEERAVAVVNKPEARKLSKRDQRKLDQIKAARMAQMNDHNNQKSSKPKKSRKDSRSR